MTPYERAESLGWIVYQVHNGGFDQWMANGWPGEDGAYATLAAIGTPAALAASDFIEGYVLAFHRFEDDTRETESSWDYESDDEMYSDLRIVESQYKDKEKELTNAFNKISDALIRDAAQYFLPQIGAEAVEELFGYGSAGW
jgi:hypothetical protein